METSKNVIQNIKKTGIHNKNFRPWNGIYTHRLRNAT